MTETTPAFNVGLESKVAFLRQPRSYPDLTYRVEAIESHMSWVFLTDDFAYKLKKPVHYDLLDFSTSAQRRHYCEEEVRLNRRLAADIYLGIVSLGIDVYCHLQLDDGEPIDWLVKMRRLPANYMLDYAIRHGSASARDIMAVAQKLARFYRSCTPITVDMTAHRNEFMHTIESNLQELSSPEFQLPIDKVRNICLRHRTFLENNSNFFDARIKTGKIVEGHGDLRPEHICLHPDLVIIDCLEFSRDLRITDTIDELSFLAMECERLGAPEWDPVLLRTYSEESNDWPPAPLVHFYQSYRATLRAKIAIRHLNEEKFRYSSEWRRRAVEYLQLAERHIQRC